MVLLLFGEIVAFSGDAADGAKDEKDLDDDDNADDSSLDGQEENDAEYRAAQDDVGMISTA